jgi:hypothetical protein
MARFSLTLYFTSTNAFFYTRAIKAMSLFKAKVLHAIDSSQRLNGDLVVPESNPKVTELKETGIEYTVLLLSPPQMYSTNSTMLLMITSLGQNQTRR